MNLRGTYFSARGLQALTTTERETWSSFSHSLRRRLWLWRRGFLSRSGVLYDLEESTYRAYVTDYQRFVRTKRINGPWSVTLSNKLLFHWLMNPFEKHRMAVYGMIRGGAFHPVDTLEPSRGTTPVAPDPSPLAFDRRDETAASTSSSTQHAPETWGATGTRDAAEWVIDRLEPDEGAALLGMLYNRVRHPKYHCRFRWAPNSVAFWDNRAVQHTAVWDYYPEVRHGFRVTLRGDKPRGSS